MESSELRLSFVIKTATSWAFQRLKQIKKNPNSKLKVPEYILRREMVLASVLGELSAVERVLEFIQNDPSVDKEAIEAELHIAIQDYNNYLASKTGRQDMHLDLEDVLKLKGYYSG